MAKNVKEPKFGKKINWRVHKENFAPPHASRKFPPGVETYSAGWFAQGHTVSQLSSESVLILFQISQIMT
jgi:hypothetical protein